MTADLVKLRQLLHRHPELSGHERRTAEIIQTYLRGCQPDALITGVGGYGLAAIFEGAHSGPRVLVRAELDALPIPEAVSLPHASDTDGVSHKCGHDGHMAIVAGLAQHLSRHRPKRGSVVLLYQPAEETGRGAELVIECDKYREFHPDMALALHNLPGFEAGQVVVGEGVFALASTGLHLKLTGQTSHAAEPEAGNSPAPALAKLIDLLPRLPQSLAVDQPAVATVIYAQLGELAFGTSPGYGEVAVTMRAGSEDAIARLLSEAESTARQLCRESGLSLSTERVEPFPATVNDPEVVDAIVKSAQSLGMSVTRIERPFGWSEDFGHFTARHKGALFGLGAGTGQPSLHDHHYDFPDELIEPGVAMLHQTTLRLLGDEIV